MSKKLLQFFPGIQALVWTVDGKAVLLTSAWGGQDPIKGKKYSDMPPRKTTPGRYVIWSYGPYETRTWLWSRLAWGTRIRASLGPTRVVYYETGGLRDPWRPITDKMPDVTYDDIVARYRALYGHTSRVHDPDGDGFPEIWVFNDFGPMAVRYFRDKNGNKKLDGDESLSGEMIHTTPDNEAAVARGTAYSLEPSHGCIHVHPRARDKFHAAGAFDRGTDFLIHAYDKLTLPEAFRISITSGLPE